MQYIIISYTPGSLDLLKTIDVALHINLCNLDLRCLFFLQTFFFLLVYANLGPIFI